MDDSRYNRFNLLRGVDRLTVALLGVRGAVVAAIDRAIIGVGFQLFVAIAADQLVVAMYAPQNPCQQS